MAEVILSRGTFVRRPLRSPLIFILLLVILFVSGTRTVWDIGEYVSRPPESAPLREHVLHWFRPASANLAEAQLSADTQPIIRRSHARRDFYEEWCRRPDTPAACTEAIPTTGPFAIEWLERRSDELRTPAASLAERNLTFANFRRGFGPGLDLRSADLSAADLSYAEFEEADFSRLDKQFGTSEPTRLVGTNLFAANLTGANLVGADLSGADLNRTNLSVARLDSADLSEALVLQPNLLGTSMSSVDLSGALISGTFFESALDKSTRDEDTAGRINSEVFDLQNTLGIADPFLPLRPSELIDAGTRITFPNLTLTAIRFVDADALNMLSVHGAFFDGSVRKTFAPHLERPCQAAEEILGDLQFFGRWRGWYEHNGGTWPPSEAIGNLPIVERVTFAEPYEGAGYDEKSVTRIRARDVTAIEPPPNCSPVLSNSGVTP